MNKLKLDLVLGVLFGTILAIMVFFNAGCASYNADRVSVNLPTDMVVSF